MPNEDYSPLVAELLAALPLAPLGPGRPDPAVRPRLAALAGEGLAPACRAGLWLAFDFLDESHEISQGLASAEGSFWHAIMHRREPDAANSKYWWRRAGDHPVLDALRRESPAAGYRFTTPEEFVDEVERVRGTGGAGEEAARRVQGLEWRLLFDHCLRRGPGHS